MMSCFLCFILLICLCVHAGKTVIAASSITIPGSEKNSKVRCILEFFSSFFLQIDSFYFVLLVMHCKVTCESMY